MGIEFDCNIGEIEEVEITEHARGTFQLYLYEAVSSNQHESSYSGSSFVFFNSEDNERLYQMFLL